MHTVKLQNHALASLKLWEPRKQQGNALAIPRDGGGLVLSDDSRVVSRYLADVGGNNVSTL
jgi:hypothetical protein